MIERLRTWFIGDLINKAQDERSTYSIILLYDSALYYFLLSSIIEISFIFVSIQQFYLEILACTSTLCTLFILKYLRSVKIATLIFTIGNFVSLTGTVFIINGGVIDVSTGICYLLLYLIAHFTLDKKIGLVYLAAAFSLMCLLVGLHYFEVTEFFSVSPHVGKHTLLFEAFTIGLAFVFLYYLINRYLRLQRMLETSLRLALNKEETLNKQLRTNEEDVLAATEYQEEIILRLAESEETLKMAQDTAKIGSWKVDLIKQTLYCSEQNYSIFELPSNYDFSLKNSHKLLDETARSIIKEAIDNSILKHIPFDVQLKITSFKGVPKWIRFIGKIEYDNDNDNPINIYGITQDITQDKDKELALEHYRQGLETFNNIASNTNLNSREQLLEALKIVTAYLELPFGFIGSVHQENYHIDLCYGEEVPLCVAQSQILPLNQTFCHITYNQKKPVAIPHIKYSSYSNYPAYQKLGYEAYIGATIWVNGKKYGTVNFVSPQPKKEGFSKNDFSFIQMLANWISSVMERDINEKKILEAKDAAEKASLAKAEFLSTMSHEIRTPLNAVIGMTHLLLQEDPRKDQIENLNALKFSGENLLALINDILDFSKIEAGGVEFESTPFSIREMTKGIKQAIAFKVEEKGIGMKVIIDEAVPETLVGDPTRLSQILNNLVSNAIKFTLEGQISIEVKLVGNKNNIADLYFSVTDTGIGISSENIDKIFDSFSQATNDTTRKFGGTGLGLTIIKRLLELQKSQIHVESQPGKGTKFYFTLGLRVASSSEYGVNRWQINAETEQENLQGIRILLVEDNEINVLVASKFLKKWAIDLKVAENGEVAVKDAKENDFDLILMDLEMPQMDGYEACRQIKKDKPTVPIIALTASATTETKEKVLQVGMNDFITKPFNPNELFQVILRNYLQKGNQALHQ